ncbi:MAG: CDP-alcohol phosphatidyltransferase family protein [Bacteroidota bacterium]|nr:CDP-alcohol phosphatidyltransferase family protein [Bacteroidota bacterium]MDP4230250.1 CDP-alcohol phosphatidyltransferase family protein [Bacteroidota bacterium]MDP4236947.1 CDP-alcohol phosphatidyltransferase family protein [Bacteroidota bacterium]
MLDPSQFRTSDKILTLSNSISFLRIFLAIPTVLALLHDDRMLAGGFMVLAYITDLLDGYIARKTNTISEFGKAIDPIADKLYVAALILVMLSLDMVPLWFVLVVIVRDILTMFGILIVRRKIGAVLPSNYWGKSAILLTIISLFLAVRGVSHDVLLFGWLASTVLIVISFSIYTVRAAKLVQTDH